MATVAGRAPRTRFTSQMDDAIRARLQGASGRTRRGEVRRAVADAAADLGVPPGAVLKRWYRLRALPARPLPTQRPRRPGAPAPDALAAYERALIRTAACRAELARAESELLEAATRLLAHPAGTDAGGRL